MKIIDLGWPWSVVTHYCG